jgi:hypothetical protein
VSSNQICAFSIAKLIAHASINAAKQIAPALAQIALEMAFANSSTLVASVFMFFPSFLPATGRCCVCLPPTRENAGRALGGDISGGGGSSVALAPLDLVTDVKFRLFQILSGVAFQVGAPDIFDRVPQIETHVPGDLDALDA